MFCAFGSSTVLSLKSTEKIRSAACFVPSLFFCFLCIYCLFLTAAAILHRVCIYLCSLLLSVCVRLNIFKTPNPFFSFEFLFRSAIALNTYCLTKKLNHPRHSYKQDIGDMSQTEQIHHSCRSKKAARNYLTKD